MSDTPQQRRWHDERGELSEAINILEDIPAAALPYIVDGISQRAENEYQLSQALQALKAMGQEKVLSLYKSKNRRRSYDKHPDLHKLVNYFFVLDEASQEQLAGELLHFSGDLVEYLATCETFDLEPNETELDEIKTRFIRQGPESVRKYIDTIHAEYNQLVLGEDDEAAPVEQPSYAPREQTVIVQDQGMKIRPRDAL